MIHPAIPTPRGAHVAETPTDAGCWDAEIDARLEGDVLVRHGRRCACTDHPAAVTR